MIYAVVAIIMIVKYLTIMIYSITFLEPRFSGLRLFGLSTLFFVLSIIRLGDENSQYYLNVNGVIGILLIVIIIFKGSLLKKVFHISFLAVLLMCQNSVLSLAIAYNREDNNPLSNLDELKSFIVSFLFVSAFFFILTVFLSKFRDSNEVVLADSEYIMLSAIPILSCLILARSILLYLPAIYEMVLNLCILAINLVTILFSNNLIRKTQQLNEFMYTEVQNDYYETRLHDIERMRTIQHDQKNIMLVILHYVESGKIEEAKDVINKLVSTNSLSRVRYADNWVIDIVLMNKIAKMENVGISYVLDAKVPSDLDLSEKAIDLCAILGNVLDNAIEEESRILSGTAINIKIFFKDQKLIIQVLNETEKTSFDSNTKNILSSKLSGRNGIGIRSIKMRSKRLGGYCDFSVFSNQFSALIVIPIGKMENARG
ncbi:GHKL domain-containing protein [Enterococcus termitis]|uniref:Sensor histidine kinase NatK-like C-terminal domain-containing protein n=1 Tax=Enterococcus termitis TaxID=332950 RepID=A0A1E5GCT5_9ENTE|nr:GHKL domain-containing protein [Enterococcus termitis]OEG10523.1 hypothetical protein BCR25_08595 [Enterococcus termitis]OJG97516.1 hypothetical protein RV18_GL000797 [Enterococcus termitis]